MAGLYLTYTHLRKAGNAKSNVLQQNSCRKIWQIATYLLPERKFFHSNGVYFQSK